MGNSETKTNEDLRTIYNQLCTSYHSVDDFRAKLLGFLPLASGAAIFGLLTIKNDSTGAPYLNEIGIFSALIMLGLLIYELKGIQKCTGYIFIGDDIERRMAGDFQVTGMFGILKKGKNISAVFTEPVASAIIYASVICAWVYIATIREQDKSFEGNSCLAVIIAVIVFSLVLLHWRLILKKNEKGNSDY